MADYASYDYLLKIVVVGESDVGKTCLQIRYADDVFCGNYITTIGVDFKLKKLQMDGKGVKMQLWDTAGQEKYRVITSCFYRGAHGVILVYDVTKQDSFDSLSAWLKNVEEYTNKDVTKLLIGNKCDLVSDRVVDYETAKNFADQVGIPYIETSAKDATNVEQAFITMVAKIKERLDLIKDPVENTDKLKLGGVTAKLKSFFQCC